MNLIKNFFHEEDGAVEIEYAFLAALIALVAAAGASPIGKDICGVFTGLGAAFLTTPFAVPSTFTACA